jgi:predicted membrane GTPase involved in stress response
MPLKDQCHKPFCITKAIDLGLKPCVVINKVDKENCTLKKFMKSFDLMFELGAKNGSWIFQQFMVLQKTTGCLIIGKT